MFHFDPCKSALTLLPGNSARGKRFWGLIVCLLALNPLVVVRADTLTLATANWSPFAYADSSEDAERSVSESVHGIAVDIAKRILEEAKLSGSFATYPANRLNQLLDRGQLDINFADSPLWNDEASRSRFIFSRPYMLVEEYLYTLAGSPLPPVSVVAPGDTHIGITMGYYYESLEPLFEAGTYRKIEITNGDQLLDILLRGRVDAIAIDSITFEFLRRKMGVPAERFQQGSRLNSAPLGFKLIPRHDDLIPILDQSIRKLVTQGEIERVVEAYLGRVENSGPSEPSNVVQD